MTDLRQAAQQALEALEEFCEHQTMLRPIEKRESLKAALAEPVQEAVQEPDNKADSIRWQLCLLAQTEEFSDDVRNQIARGVWLIDRLRATLAEPQEPVQEPWEHLKQYGYAPGSYMSKCHICDKIASGVDKRAITCRPCAEARHAESQKAEPVQDTAFDRWWDNALDGPTPVAPVSKETARWIWNAARAEPVQEPVAQVHPNHLKPTDDGKPWCREVLLYSGDHNGDLFKGENYRVKLYTAPPQRLPLSEDEKRALADKFLSCQPESYEVSGVFDLISAVERAHGIKE